MRIVVETEDDGRLIAEVPAIPGAMVYGDTADEAIREVESLVLRILTDRIGAGEAVWSFLSFSLARHSFNVRKGKKIGSRKAQRTQRWMKAA